LNVALFSAYVPIGAEGRVVGIDHGWWIPAENAESSR
jgi:hypothetical protein